LSKSSAKTVAMKLLLVAVLGRVLSDVVGLGDYDVLGRPHWKKFDVVDNRVDCGVRTRLLRAVERKIDKYDTDELKEALGLNSKLCKQGEIQVVEFAKDRFEQPEKVKQDEIEKCRIFVGGKSATRTVLEGVKALRSMSGCVRKVLELDNGVHFLNETIKLGPKDSNLTIRGKKNTWVSGGKHVEVIKSHIVSGRLVNFPVEGNVSGLFGLRPHVRFQRARYPNGDVEKKFTGFSGGDVKEWIKPKPRGIPKFNFMDLRQSNPSGFLKNDSSQMNYNQYTSGRGGVCDDIWDTSYSSSYWCGNVSSGGWAEVDFENVRQGTVGLPVGLEFYSNSSLRGWKNVTGAIVHVWHSQYWFTNMFEVSSKVDNKLMFLKGGSQGGRNWCTCSQCSYIAPWCGKHNDTRLISGNWYVENILDALDVPGEYFQHSNKTVSALLSDKQIMQLQNNHPLVLVVPKLQTLFDISNTSGIIIANVGFRDAASTYMEKHGVPSGGDWALFRGGAVTLSNVNNIRIEKCRFRRLDGNGVILLGRTRKVHLVGNRFSYLGASAMAAWGETEEWDGRSGNQPRDTLVEQNTVRDIGLYQKQSSAWFQAKSCQTNLSNNLFFNLPRAAINFNDGFGGNNLVTGNIIFNTCRESGDHGPINSWDRQPFAWDDEYGFKPKPTTIERNLIVANFGAGWSVDNDDGSSFYAIQDNLFYDSDGLKMDYGGHDSTFLNNLVITSATAPFGNCYRVDSPFFEGRQHTFVNNTCIIRGCRGPPCNLVGVVGQEFSSPGTINSSENRYFGSPKQGLIQDIVHDTRATLKEAQVQYSIDTGSSYTAVDDPRIIILRYVESYLENQFSVEF